MDIRSRHNQYHGINAHLHSWWQAEGGWNGFHLSYVVQLTVSLKEQLFPMGYTVCVEGSRQIRRFDDPTESFSEETGKPYQAIGIYTVEQKHRDPGEAVAWIELLSPQKTFSDMLYRLELVNYAQRPANFDRYNPRDQAVILSLMVTLMQRVREGDELPESPPTFAPQPLAEAHEQWSAFNNLDG